MYLYIVYLSQLNTLARTLDVWHVCVCLPLNADVSILGFAFLRKLTSDCP